MRVSGYSGIHNASTGTLVTLTAREDDDGRSRGVSQACLLSQDGTLEEARTTISEQGSQAFLDVWIKLIDSISSRSYGSTTRTPLASTLFTPRQHTHHDSQSCPSTGKRSQSTEHSEPAAQPNLMTNPTHSG